jgi:hypothetical protein
MNWSKTLTAVATALLGGGIAWLVSTTVQSESALAVQKRDNEAQSEQLHDHELRTRSLEGVSSQLAHTLSEVKENQKRTTEVLEALKDEARQKRRQR